MVERLEAKSGNKFVTTDEIKSISQAISVEKIADMKAKFKARQMKTIQKVDESSDIRKMPFIYVIIIDLKVIFNLALFDLVNTPLH